MPDTTHNLGPLKDLYDRVKDPCLRLILVRMAEVDSYVSKSLYSSEHTEDRPPEGEDYNLLFDAVIDEIKASLEART